MLEAEEGRQQEGHAVMQAEEGARGAARAGDEGNVGAEEGGVVVVANEAIAGGDLLDDTADNGLLGRGARKAGGIGGVHCVRYGQGAQAGGCESRDLCLWKKGRRLGRWQGHRCYSQEPRDEDGKDLAVIEAANLLKPREDSRILGR